VASARLPGGRLCAGGYDLLGVTSSSVVGVNAIVGFGFGTRNGRFTHSLPLSERKHRWLTESNDRRHPLLKFTE